MRVPIGKNEETEKPIFRPSTSIGRVIETVFRCDIWSDYQELKAKLKVGDGHADYRTILRASDEAEVNWLKASKLLANAELERKRYEIEATKLVSAMRASANRALQDEKQKGDRRKTITNQDLDDYCATYFEDQWSHIGCERLQYEQTIEHVKVLVEAWKSRCRTLQGMLARVKSGPLT